MSEELFPEVVAVDWPAFKKIGKHSRLHIIARRLASGLHPLGHAKLAENGETCGSCSHRRLNDFHDGRYWKCNQVPMTGGPASDIRLKWPACIRYAQGVTTDDYSVTTSLVTGLRR